MLNISNWLSGGGGAILGALIGGVVTAHYNSKESKKKLKKEIQVKSLEEIITKIMENKSKLNSFEFFLNTKINTLSVNDFSNSFFQEDNIVTFVDNLNRIIYESTKSCEELVWTIEKRQVVLLSNKTTVNKIQDTATEIINIMKKSSDLLIADYVNKINKKDKVDVENNKIKENINMFKISKDKYYTILYNFDIELENEIFGDIFDKHIKN